MKELARYFILVPAFLSQAALAEGVALAFHNNITGEIAEKIYHHLDDGLVVAELVDGEYSIVQKRGWSISCQKLTHLADHSISYECGQYFFYDGFTSNPELSYEVANTNVGNDIYLLVLNYHSELAESLFKLAELSFPGSVEVCQSKQDCGYQRIIRAPDLSCYEISVKNGDLTYSCSQILENTEGSAIPGGGDPIIGVVLGVVDMGDVSP